MATWTSLPTGTKDILMDGIEKEMKGKTLAQVNQWRDEKLIKLLKVIYE